jgi:hypothetical protein
MHFILVITISIHLHWFGITVLFHDPARLPRTVDAALKAVYHLIQL